MSTRSQAWASEGVSKAAASQYWVEAAAKISEVREHDLRTTPFFGLMLDGRRRRCTT